MLKPHTVFAAALAVVFSLSGCGVSEDPSGRSSQQVTVAYPDGGTAAGNAGCTYTQGYWKNHPTAWPVTSLTLGTRTYTQAELLVIFRTPVKGNGLISLSHQLIAAKLNLAAGAAGGALGTSIADADAMIGNLVVGSGSLSTSATSPLTGKLDAFNNGVTNVTTQVDRTWRYFKIVVPPAALGWDIRLVNVTAGTPAMMIRRDLLPEGSGNIPYDWNPGYSDTWPSGNQWAAGPDWTGRNYASDGQYAPPNMVAMGMGRPLEAGTYYVGVYATGDSSYTLQSRGIGSGLDVERKLREHGLGLAHGLRPGERNVELVSSPMKLFPSSSDTFMVCAPGLMLAK